MWESLQRLGQRLLRRLCGHTVQVQLRVLPPQLFGMAQHLRADDEARGSLARAQIVVPREWRIGTDAQDVSRRVFGEHDGQVVSLTGSDDDTSPRDHAVGEECSRLDLADREVERLLDGPAAHQVDEPGHDGGNVLADEGWESERHPWREDVHVVDLIVRRAVGVLRQLLGERAQEAGDPRRRAEQRHLVPEPLECVGLIRMEHPEQWLVRPRHCHRTHQDMGLARRHRGVPIATSTQAVRWIKRRGSGKAVLRATAARGCAACGTRRGSPPIPSTRIPRLGGTRFRPRLLRH